MIKKKYDVAIAYRTYSGSQPSRARVIFHDNKYKLEDFCLSSLKKSLGSLKFKIWAILDSCPQNWEELFKKYFNEEELEIVNVENAGEVGSLKVAMNILLDQEFSEYIYMAEDDYYYLPQQFEKMINFIKFNSNVDFITPYDHPDYYFHKLHEYSSYIKVFFGLHWRTVSTTCNTYLTTKAVLFQTKDVFLRSYSSKNFFSQDFFLKKKKKD